MEQHSGTLSITTVYSNNDRSKNSVFDEKYSNKRHNSDETYYSVVIRVV